ncbi:MAG: anhydro-N-acetylmuramic acid kinase [Burkholderiales bacterium]|nr:anhydro-N-acetylmuramic acid kinase [Burkholderiales bacterium]
MTTHSRTELYIGIMSGTSLDGADAVCVKFEGDKLLKTWSTSLPFSEKLKEELLSLCTPGFDEINRSQKAAWQISEIYAEVCKKLFEETGIDPKKIKAIGAHGQTVRHNPQFHATTQLINGALLAELTGIPVVCDFRSRDMAAGGQGAPLVPPFHQEVFASHDCTRAIVNIGGISNITVIPPKGSGKGAFGFDCGPGNMLLDLWIHKSKGEAFDRDGSWARKGNVIPKLLKNFSTEKFFKLVPPKSTGRELFNSGWLTKKLTTFSNEKAVDIQRTLLELTSQSIVDAIKNYAPKTEEIYLCGGGSQNLFMKERIASEANGMKVSDTSELGLGTQDVEGAAFAWLAKRFMEGLPGNLPKATGAKGLRILGCLFPS